MGKFEKEVRRYAEWVIKEARSNLSKKNTTGKLSGSLSYILLKKGVQFEMEDYGIYQDKGVKGAESTYSETAREHALSNVDYKYKKSANAFKKGAKVVPPTSVFDKWQVKKGLAPRDEKGRFLPRKSLNFMIARSIYKKGIRASLFFTKPFESGIAIFGPSMVSAYIEDNTSIFKIEEL